MSEREGRAADLRLAEVAREVTAGLASRQALHETFLAATVFCEAGDRPGFLAVGSPGKVLIPVFSPEAELLRAPRTTPPEHSASSSLKRLSRWPQLGPAPPPREPAQRSALLDRPDLPPSLQPKSQGPGGSLATLST